MPEEKPIDPEEACRAAAAWERAAQDADATVDLPKADGSGTVPMFFRWIPAGSFRMGSRGIRSEEEPIHRVTIPEDFYCGTFPVTQAQFAAFREEHENHFANRPQNPVEQVSWDDAQAFVVWLNKRPSLLPPGFAVALPSEAQWEYACRAGSETDYSSGDGESALREVGWFKGNSGKETHPVGALKPNAWKVYDLHGNVLEWCEDVWDANAHRKREDQRKPWRERDAGNDVEKYEGRPSRVFRGGSYFFTAWRCRSADRDWSGPGFRSGIRGFRLVLVPVSASPEPASRAGGAERAGAGSDGTERTADARGGAPDLSKEGQLPDLDSLDWL